MFKLTRQTPYGRRGELELAHGNVQTPFFLPVATAGAMKGLMLDDLTALGFEMLLANTYHLHSSPGEDTIAAAGGLHEFIGWNKPILTDSGGFQVFSLKGIRKVVDTGVHFQDHRSGAPLFIGPEEAMTIQHKFGSDIIMCFDECPPSTAPRVDQMKAVDRTLAWAKVCKQKHEQLNTKKRSKLFGIVQGGLEKDLRIKCAEELIAIGFDGYAIGGLAVGETQEEMYDILDVVCPLLPVDKPRYLMGVGELNQLSEAIKKGIDMFDCVSPMREARHGNIWLSNGSKFNITRAEFKDDHSVIDPDSPTPLGRIHKKSYLHHLMRINERYGETIACMQNMAIMQTMMTDLRKKMDA